MAKKTGDLAGPAFKPATYAILQKPVVDQCKKMCHRTIIDLPELPGRGKLFCGAVIEDEKR